MEYYQVVPVDDEGMFLEDPEQFDTQHEAERRWNEKQDLHPDLDWVVFQCEDITYRLKRKPIK